MKIDNWLQAHVSCYTINLLLVFTIQQIPGYVFNCQNSFFFSGMYQNTSAATTVLFITCLCVFNDLRNKPTSMSRCCMFQKRIVVVLTLASSWTLFLLRSRSCLYLLLFLFSESLRKQDRQLDQPDLKSTRKIRENQETTT